MPEYWNTARTVQMVVDACAALGVDTTAVLAAADIDPEVVADPEGRVSLDQMRAFWFEAVARSGDPAIGLHAAQHVPHGLYGLIDYLFGYAVTVGDGIELMMRYLPLINNWIVPSVEVDDDYATLTLDVVWRSIPRTSAEYVFALLAVRGRAVWQVDWTPALIRFEFPAPRPPEPVGDHARVFGCGIEFGADATQMIVE
ncbi:MAG: AraC family transcriptional regulator, partial [Acidimicrobiales bacterium]